MNFHFFAHTADITPNLFENIGDSIQYRLPDNKASDAFVFENDTHFILLHGVIVNLNELLKEYKESTKEQLFIQLFDAYEEQFPNQLQGTFSIVFIEKKNQKIWLFADHISAKTLFYISDEAYVGFSSNLFELASITKNEPVDQSIDWRTFSYMSKYGHMPGDATFIKSIKKVQAGHYVTFYNGQIDVVKYHQWRFGTNTDISFEDAVDELDRRFKKAVRLHFEKDVALGKKHIGSLSGGLDSRMTLVTAHTLGYRGISHFTFSAKGYWDEVIAKQIAKDLKFKSFLFSLENTDHLHDSYDRIFEATSGTVMSHLISHLPSFYEQLDLKSYGYFHTGQVGDAIIGNTLHVYEEHHSSGPKRGFFNTHDDFINAIWEEECDKYETLEETQFQNHVFNFALNGDWVTSQSIETLSPFLHQEVMGFCLDLPLSYRHKHRLYMAWLKKYFPETGKYYYEKKKAVTFRNRTLSSKLLRRIQLKWEHIKLARLGLDKNASSLLGVDQLHSFFDSNNLKEVITSNIEVIPVKELQERLTLMCEDTNVHSHFLAYHVILTILKYKTIAS